MQIHTQCIVPILLLLVLLLSHLLSLMILSPPAAYPRRSKCYFCGGSYHNRRVCPARDACCNNCNKKGHFRKVCRSNSNAGATATIYEDPSAIAAIHCFPTYNCTTGITAAFPQSLSHAAVPLSIHGHTLTALIDSCISDSFMSENIAKMLKLKIKPSTRNISMALSTMNTTILVYCEIDLKLNGHDYKNVRLSLLKDRCSDVILGHDFQKQHQHLKFNLEGQKPGLVIPFPSDITCAVSAASIGDASLFTNILPTCRPIATRSRHFSVNDKAFIQSEIVKLLQTGVIEPSSSPWRAQEVVVKNPSQPDKKRLSVDYSQTINQYTELDAYPLPRKDDVINNLAHYKVFSTFDLRNAYHQVPILKDDRKYTGFEANGRLYQFRRIPFGVTNGVAVFQRLMDNIIKEEKLKDTFPYLDDITVAGVNQADHDKNVEAFLDVVKSQNLTLNHAKSVISASSINVLGYLVRDGNIRPNPERLRPLKELPLPTNVQSLRRTLGLFHRHIQ